MEREDLILKLKEHPRLYYTIKCIRGFGNKTFVCDVNRMNECDLILDFQRNGELYPEKNIYYIENNSDVRGFFSLFFLVLDALSIADKYHLTPVVKLGEKTLYYQGSEINGSMNPFEYYFEPVSDVSIDEVKHCANVWYYCDGHRNADFNKPFSVASQSLGGDQENSQYVQRNAALVKKYIRYKPEVSQYLSSNMDGLIGEKRVLGIHVRGTDFNAGYLNHAKAVSIEQYIEEAKKAVDQCGFECIFLATDEEKAVAAFKEEFGDKVLFYNDALRSTTGEALHFSVSERENHRYLLGLEVLRDAVTLSGCSGLIAGLSNVSLAARTIKGSRDERYDYIDIIENGFNTTGKRLKRSR